MKKLFENKKGDISAFLLPQKVFFYILLIIFFGIVIIGTVIVITDLYKSKILLKDTVESDFALSRLTNVCFAYRDENTAQFELNVLDETKLTETYLKSCFKSDKPTSFGVTIKPINSGDFKTLDLNLGKTKAADYKFSKYTLVRLKSGKTVPATIFYRP